VGEAITAAGEGTEEEKEGVGIHPT